MIDVIFFHGSRGLSVSLLSIPFGANARRSRAENHKKKKDWHPLQISIPRYFLPHPADVQHALDARNSPSRLLVRGSWTAALVGLVRQRIGPPRARVSSASIIALQVQFPRFIVSLFHFHDVLFPCILSAVGGDTFSWPDSVRVVWASACRVRMKPTLAARDV